MSAINLKRRTENVISSTVGTIRPAVNCLVRNDGERLVLPHSEELPIRSDPSDGQCPVPLSLCPTHSELT